MESLNNIFETLKTRSAKVERNTMVLGILIFMIYLVELYAFYIMDPELWYVIMTKELFRHN